MSDDSLFDVALSVTDGVPVDWAEQESKIPAEERRLLERLRQIQGIAQIHTLPHDADVYESIRDQQAATASTPVRWGPFEIVEKVGSGSYGDVYRARDPRLGREVALKLLRDRTASASEESSIIHEGHLLSRVRHQNVVTVYGAERFDGRTGLWMEFIAGETLEQELRRRGPLPEGEVARLGLELCAALEAVHAAGLLHRDMKAQNVIRDPAGRVVLMDFGAGHDAQHGAAHEGLAGTPAYLAPEILAGAPPDVTTDIYALGVVLFHIATGQFPVEGRTLREVREAHSRGRGRALSSLRPDLPDSLAGVIRRAASGDRSERYADATEMRLALERVIAVPRRRRVLAQWLAASLLAAAVAIGVWILGPFDGTAVRQRPMEQGEARLRTLWDEGNAGGVDFGTASYDGRFVTSFGSEPRALLLRDLQSGSTRTLIPSSRAEGPEFSAISRHGTFVAYTWQSNSRYELRIASTAAGGAAPRVVVHADESRFDYVIPCDWSPDGTKIVAAFRRGDAMDLMLVNVSDGSVRLLTSGHWGLPVRAVFSTDGTHVAASLRSDVHSPQHDIVLLRIDSEAPALETSRIPGPAHDIVAGWSPDGTHLLFLSDRTGTAGLWSAEIQNGSPVGNATLVRPDVAGTPLGVIRSGALLLAVPINNRDIYLAWVDFETGRVLSAPTRPIPSYVGSNRAPNFSPDGKSLAYVSQRSGNEPGLYLGVQSLDDGSVRHLRLGMRTFLQMSWSPDSTSVVGLGHHVETGPGVYRVDVTTGNSTLLLREGGLPQFSPDAATLYYVRPTARPPFELVERLLATGRERVLLRNDARMYASVAPDGRHIAAIVGSPGETPASPRTLVLRSTAGGEARELLQASAAELTFLVRWTPDSRRVLVWQSGRMRVIPIDGGQPRTIELEIVPEPQREEHLSLHPDGRRVAYMAGTSRMELWSLENYLPSLRNASGR